MIELLAAVLIVSFGILGLLSLLSRSTVAATGNEDSLRAAMLANEMASTMWAAGTVSLPGPVTAAWNTRVGTDPVAGLPNGSGTVVVNGRVARIRVKWRPPGSTDDRQYMTDVVVVPDVINLP